MNNTIVVLDQQTMNLPTADTNKRHDYFKRRAVRAVISDDAGRIALIYAKQRDYYKLPGGGVDDDEGLVEALNRELLEEVGALVTVTAELGEVVEWRDFKKMKQTSYCYKASLVGEPGQTSRTQSEIDEGFEVRWIDSLDEAIGLVEAETNHQDIAVVFMSRRDAAILKAAKQG